MVAEGSLVGSMKVAGRSFQAVQGDRRHQIFLASASTQERQFHQQREGVDGGQRADCGHDAAHPKQDRAAQNERHRGEHDGDLQQSLPVVEIGIAPEGKIAFRLQAARLGEQAPSCPRRSPVRSRSARPWRGICRACPAGISACSRPAPA